MSVALRTTNMRDAVVNEIREQILSGDIPPGAPLAESVLAAQLGVARPTVRSALQVLAALGLAQQSGGRSLVVPTLTADDVRDLFFVRIPLELEAVRVIIDKDLPVGSVELALRELERLPKGASWADRVLAHTDFHVALIDAAGSPRLSRIYRPLQEETQLCLARLKPSYPHPDDLVKEHIRLLRTVQLGDISVAQREMLDHCDNAMHGLLGQ